MTETTTQESRAGSNGIKVTIQKTVPISDARRIEAVCRPALPSSLMLAVDAASPSADFQPGIALTFAERRKTRETDPELVRARSCRLVVFGIETGGVGAKKQPLSSASLRTRALRTLNPVLQVNAWRSGADSPKPFVTHSPCWHLPQLRAPGPP